MELYGVHHGGEFIFGGLPLVKMEVEPAQQILNAIKDLPKGSIVGVESVQKEELEAENGLLAFNESDIRYWHTIIGECIKSGHSVAYLDSYGIHKMAAHSRMELGHLERALRSGTYSVAPGQERVVAEIQFALKAEAEYLFSVAREDYIFSKLAKLQPQLAVIGLAHADLLMLKPDLIKELGVDEYWKAVLDESTIPAPVVLMSERPIRMTQTLEHAPPDPIYLKERELIIRTYRAATLGRIAIDTEPEWIGSWCPDIRPVGLFEVYPISGLEGEIEDRMGTASYSGEFGDERIKFVKVYDPNRVLDPNAAHKPITYEARRSSDEEYEGVWYTEGPYPLEGEFVIKRGNFLYEPPDINFGQQKLF